MGGQFKGPNIALNKPTAQYPGDYCNNLRCYGAELAVDGLLDEPFTWQGHCTHTSVQSSTSAYWTVNFTEFYQISGIIVYNRIHEVLFGRRLRDFTVYGIQPGQPPEQLLLYTYNYTFTDDNYPRKIEIPLTDYPNVSGIRIEIPRRPFNEETLLSLCEVEVFSDFTCEPLQLSANLKVNYTNSSKSGSVATFSCADGYYLPEESSLVCQGYRWSGQPPICTKVYCQFPLNISHGQYSVSDPCVSLLSNSGLPYECSIRPGCNRGFNLTQGRIRYCLDSRQWSDEDPVCEIVKCVVPKQQNGWYTYSNGSAVVDASINYGIEIQSKCNIGYTLMSGTFARFCQKDGFLNGTDAACQIVTCPSLQTNDTLNYTYSHKTQDQLVPFNSTVTITCKNGLLREGSDIRRCTENRTWDGRSPVCVPACITPSVNDGELLLEDGSVTYQTMFAENQKLYLSCSSGYTSSHRVPIITCLNSSRWSGNPVCNRLTTENVVPVKTAAAIGGVLGTVIVFLAAVVLIFVVRERKHTRARKQAELQDYSNLEQTQSSNNNTYDMLTETNLTA